MSEQESKILCSRKDLSQSFLIDRKGKQPKSISRVHTKKLFLFVLAELQRRLPRSFTTGRNKDDMFGFSTTSITALRHTG